MDMTKLLNNKKRAAILCAIVIAAGFAVWMIEPSFLLASAAKRDLPIYSVQRDYKTASLTFDAAWGNEDTQQLIDILAKYEVKATFFVVGDWARKYPESVKQLHDAGHEVMNHSDTHAHMPKLSRDEIMQDIQRCNDAVAEVTGVAPTLFRPPYGEYDDKLVSTLRGMGMYTIQWDVDSLDWKNPTPADMQKRVLSKVQPGSIVLFHNAAKNTPTALPGIIEGLQKDGYKLVPVTQIIHTGEFTIDHTGKQIPVVDPAASPTAKMQNTCTQKNCSCPPDQCKCTDEVYC